MTTDHSRKGEDGPRHLVAQAERQLAFFGAVLDRAAEDIMAGTYDPPRDLAATVAALRKALEAVLNERARLEKLDAGSGHRPGMLDLDAARDEIRRRMARLRAAQGAGGVSGQSE